MMCFPNDPYVWNIVTLRRSSVTTRNSIHKDWYVWMKKWRDNLCKVFFSRSRYVNFLDILFWEQYFFIQAELFISRCVGNTSFSLKETFEPETCSFLELTHLYNGVPEETRDSCLNLYRWQLRHEKLQNYSKPGHCVQTYFVEVRIVLHDTPQRSIFISLAQLFS